MSPHQNEVEQLFREAADRHHPIRTNPVTGGRFVNGIDPTTPQKRLAEKALAAREWFDEQRPADAPELPLTQWGREDIKVPGIGYMVSLFARSLAMRDYETEGHPGFDEYARGVMASPLTPDLIRNDPELQKRYPPALLAGLGGGLIWRRPKLS